MIPTLRELEPDARVVLPGRPGTRAWRPEPVTGFWGTPMQRAAGRAGERSRREPTGEDNTLFLNDLSARRTGPFVGPCLTPNPQSRPTYGPIQPLKPLKT